MKDLQHFINEKAKEKLNSDIMEFINAFRNTKFFDALRDMEIKIDAQQNIGMRFDQFFICRDDAYGYKVIFNYFFPKYVEKESKEFYDKISKQSKNESKN